MILGLHVSIAGKIDEAVDRAAVLDCSAFQIFSRNPRGWRVEKLEEAEAERFREKRAQRGIAVAAVHMPYIMNLASPDKRLYKISIKAYIEDIKRADQLGADFFVTHLGSHRGAGEEFGEKRFAEAINTIISTANPQAMILLETTAGTGNSLGHKFEQIQRIIRKVERREQVGICLDTCHIYAAGYDIKSKKGLSRTMKEFEDIIGMANLKLVHLNDSQGELGQRVDRHEDIGDGKIGLEGFRNFLNYPKLNNLPFILETPNRKLNGDRKNLSIVRSLAGQ